MCGEEVPTELITLTLYKFPRKKGKEGVFYSGLKGIITVFVGDLIETFDYLLPTYLYA